MHHGFVWLYFFQHNMVIIIIAGGNLETKIGMYSETSILLIRSNIYDRPHPITSNYLPGEQYTHTRGLTHPYTLNTHTLLSSLSLSLSVSLSLSLSLSLMHVHIY